MAAGDSITIAKPWFYLGDLYPTPAIFPPLSLAARAAWPTGWSRLKGYQNGVNVTIQNPRVAIPTSDLGVVAYVGTGAHGIQIQTQFRLPTATLMEKLASFYKVSKATAVGPPAHPAAELWFQDANDELGTNPTSEFRIGIEGVALAGSLYATQRIMRFIGFRCQQGGNIGLRWDHTGNDAGLFPTMTAQALPYTVTDAEVTDSGVAVADIKSDRAIWMNIGT
jgi:hypothetical protein